MKVKAIKTRRVVPGKDKDLLALLDQYLPPLKEGSIVAVTSKVAAICEGSFVKAGSTDKYALIAKESEYYLPAKLNKYGVMLTIKNNILAPSAGVDESNAKGHYILWPKNPQKTANEVRKHLRKKHRRKKIGVIITDSRILPLHWGTIGVALSFSGFEPLKNYVGQKDLFGRKLKVTIANLADALAACAVLAIGEGAEQTPFAIITEAAFVRFKSGNPTKKELKKFSVPMQEDHLWAKILTTLKWKKGGSFIKKVK